MKILYCFFIITLTLAGSSLNGQTLTLDYSKFPESLLYLHDSFENDSNSSLASFNHSRARCYFDKGTLVFENKLEESSYMRWNDYGIDPEKDYFYEWDFSFIHGPETYGSGIIFNSTTTDISNKYFLHTKKL